MSLSLTFTVVRASYALVVGLLRHVALGGDSRRYHIVSQVRRHGRWRAYDCLDEGRVVTSSDTYDIGWHASPLHMVVVF